MHPEAYPEPAPDDDARTVAAELLQRIALDVGGALFDDGDPDTWDEADATDPEIVRLGPARFKIVSADAGDLAIAVGAIEPGDLTPCWLVQFAADKGAPQPSMGLYLNIATEEPGVSVLFRLWITSFDVNDPAAPDFGSGATRNPALDAIAGHPGRALLVQVFGDDQGVAQQ